MCRVFFFFFFFTWLHLQSQTRWWAFIFWSCVFSCLDRAHCCDPGTVHVCVIRSTLQTTESCIGDEVTEQWKLCLLAFIFIYLNHFLVVQSAVILTHRYQPPFGLKAELIQAMSTRTKTIFLPPSSSASFQEYLRPNGSIVNDSTRCSSYSRPIGGAWNSPKTEAKRRSMHSGRRNQTKQEEDDTG